MVKRMVRKTGRLLNKAHPVLFKFYRNLPIRQKLMLVLNIMLIIPLVGVSYLSFKSSEESLKKKSTQYSQDIIRLLELRLKDYTNNVYLISQDLLQDKRVLTSFSDTHGSPESLDVYEDASQLDGLLSKVIFSRKEIQSIALISNAGNYIYKDAKSDFSIKNLMPFDGQLYRELQIAAWKGKGLPVYSFSVQDGRVDQIYFCRAIYDLDTFNRTGLMVILLKPDYLDTVLKDLVYEDMKNIFVLSEKNQVIFSKDSSPGNDLDVILGRIHEKKGWFIDEENKMIITHASLEDPQWRIVSCVSLTTLYKDIDGLRLKIILTSIAAMLVLSTIIFVMAYDLSKPIKRLVRGMQKVQAGDKNIQLELQRKDEIGFLGDAFNTMVKELNLLSNWIYREQLTRKEGELKALQAQINPHFLFNTLETINWMAHLGNNPEITETVSALSSLMEASIGKGDRLIPFKAELEYIDNYYLILKKRFEDRITLEKLIDEKALDILIPRLLIQPLIENAIYHGIANRQNAGRILIDAKVKDGELFISIEDNGLGISKEDLASLNEVLSMDNDTYFMSLENKKSKSIGLENVNRRVKLFYGEHYGLKLESEEHYFTRVIVTIPVEPVNYRMYGG